MAKVAVVNRDAQEAGGLPKGRFLTACVLAASGCGALVYRVIGAPTPATDSDPGRPWRVVVLPAYVLDSANVATIVVGAGGLGALLTWAVRRRLDPALSLLAGSFVLAGGLTGAVLQIVSAPAWSPTYAKLAIASLVVAWLGVLVACRAVMRARLGASTARARGCAYCSVDLNIVAGDVQQLAIRDDQRAVLLRCPRCEWLYEAPVSDESIEPAHLTEAQARETYVFP